MTDLTSHPWFFCGIGGSGMLPLALILKGQGAVIAGSDRSRDQGRTPEKFAWLESLGITLFAQDGSGVTAAEQTLVASTAVEDTVPEMVRARELGCPRMSRAELLARLFNAAPTGIAVGGTSGKSTVTGMIGWILVETGRDPTIMNGAVMKNFVAPDAPFASARVGGGETFVSEVDESDGSIALYRPKVAVLGNVSLDHKSLEELRQLFGDFLAHADVAAVNLDDAETAALAARAKTTVTFGIDSTEAAIGIGAFIEGPTSLAATILDRRDGSAHELRLKVPGRHNLANALAAYEEGVRCFDSSLGGLGGCPFAPGASGNVITEDLVFMFEAMGVKTGVDLDKLMAARKLMVEAIPQEPTYGHFALAGVPKGFREGVANTSA